MSGKRLFQSICICVFGGCLCLGALPMQDNSAGGVVSAFADSEENGWIVPDDSENVHWQTQQQTVNVDGKDYVVQTLTAQPKNSASNLVITGDVVRNFPDEESENAILRMLSQTYKDIKAYLNGGLYEGPGISYVYCGEQNVSFIYVKELGAEQMKLSHVSSMCTATVGYQYTGFSVEDGAASPDSVQGTIEFTEIPDGYNSIPLAVKAYQESKTTEAFVTDMELTGVDFQIVATLHPLKPKKPQQIM